MLFEFKSRATGSVVMTNDVGKKVLPLIGKSPDPQGVITVEQMPGAIAALEAACEREKALAAAAKLKARSPAGQSTGDPADAGRPAETGTAASDNDESKDDPMLIGICQRVFPLVEMLKSSHAAGKDVTWGV